MSTPPATKIVYVYGAKDEVAWSGSPFYFSESLRALAAESEGFSVENLATRRARDVPLAYAKWCATYRSTRIGLFLLSAEFHDRSSVPEPPEEVRPFFVSFFQRTPRRILEARRARPDARLIQYVDVTFAEYARDFGAAQGCPRAYMRQLVEDETHAYRTSDLICTFRPDTRDVLSSSYGIPSSKIRVLGRGVNLKPGDVGAAASRRAGRAADTPLNLMVVGRAARRKGVFRLIEAIDRLPAAERARLVLTVAGPSIDELPRRPYLRALGFLGADRKQELVEEMARADLGVLLSDAEGLAGSVWEFLALGKPVWVSDLDGMRELARSHPVILEEMPFDPDAIFAKCSAFVRAPGTITGLGRPEGRYEDLSWRPQARFIRDYVLAA